MSSHSSQRGEGKIGCILTLLVFLAALALGLKVVPVYYANSNLQEYANDVAGEAGLYPLPELTAKMRAKASDLGIPEALADGAITISTTGSRSNGLCTITLDYARTVDLYGTYPLVVATKKVVSRPYMDAR
ncbi:MAG: hypothetical protein P4L36_12215 [Holophaga sp.]|nr:hypothetical protein [Holophaga sp.]